MSDFISAINQAANVTTTSDKDNNSDDAVMGKEDFLMLLVAQLQNQDPLNPDEPTEFTAQLAQFSSLEQLFTLNDSMEALVNASQSSDQLSTLSTIGRDVAFESNSFEFNGDNVDLGYQLSSDASEVSVVLQLNGATIATLEGTELSSGNHYLSWDGLMEDGQQAPHGDYTILVQAQGLGEDPIVAQSLLISEVTGVDLNGESGGTLITAAGEISFNSILGVYDPQDDRKDEKQDEEQTSLTETVEEAIETIANVTDDAANVT